jgi:UDP-glucose 4-epimerase
VYDANKGGLVNETSKLKPLNPYGSSKLMSERIIQDIAKVSELNFFILRYFNVAGCDLLNRSGQMHENATHLIKVCVECALNKREKVEIFGNQHQTKDGTCVRDYIHISDLISGHLIALEHLVNNGNSDICNLGYGTGYSVLEIVNQAKKLSGNNFRVKFTKALEGHPPFLISDPRTMKNIYQWQPKHNYINEIISSSLSLEKQLP